MNVRKSDAADRRRVSVTDTAAGRDATLQAWLPAIEAIDEVCRSLSDSEQVFTRHVLDRLTTVMTRSSQP